MPHHWLLVLHTSREKTQIARTYRLPTVAAIARVLGSSTTVISNTIHGLILPRECARYCDIYKIATTRCAGRCVGLRRPGPRPFGDTALRPAPCLTAGRALPPRLCACYSRAAPAHCPLHPL